MNRGSASPLPGSSATIIAADRIIAAALKDAGWRVAERADRSFAVVIATDRLQAEEALRLGCLFLLRARDEPERDFLLTHHLAHGAFTDIPDLLEKLRALEDDGWRWMGHEPSQLDLSLEVAEQRAWLAALREAEVAARTAHERDASRVRAHIARQGEHITALETELEVVRRERSAFSARIQDMEGTVAWRIHMALARVQRRARSALRRHGR